MPCMRFLFRSLKPVRCLAKESQIRLSSSYTAAVLDGKDEKSPFKLIDVKGGKKLKKGQMRLRVKACTFNVWDYAIASGERKTSNTTLGYEICGQVLEVSDSPNFAKGDKVIAYSKATMGGFAEEIIIDEQDVWLKPNNVQSAEGCTLVEGYGTAVLGIVQNRPLVEKQPFVVTLATGQGLASLDIAANVYRAKVLAVCEHEGEESSGLREKGAWSAVAFTEDNVKRAIKKLSQGSGVTSAYSTLSGAPLTALLSNMSHGGEVMYAGYQDLPPLSAEDLLHMPLFKLTPLSLWGVRSTAFDKYRKAVDEALELCEQRLISPYVAAKFKLVDVNKAFHLLRDKRPMGKVVITID